MRVFRVEQSVFARFGGRFILTSTLLVAAAAVAPAAAAPITFAFEAEVRNVIDFHNIIPGGTIKAGDVFTGRYTFESTMLDKNPLASVGEYYDSAPGIGFDVGGFTFQTDPASVNTVIQVTNGSLQDVYVYHSLNNLAIGPALFVREITLGLTDQSATAFNSDALPLTPLNLALFTQTPGLKVRGDIGPGDHWFEFYATLRTLKEVPPDTDPIPAPEPTTAVLILSGLAVIARRGHARLRAMRWE